METKQKSPKTKGRILMVVGLVAVGLAVAELTGGTAANAQVAPPDPTPATELTQEPTITPTPTSTPEICVEP